MLLRIEYGIVNLDQFAGIRVCDGKLVARTPDASVVWVLGEYGSDDEALDVLDTITYKLRWAQRGNRGTVDLRQLGGYR